MTSTATDFDRAPAFLARRAQQAEEALRQYMSSMDGVPPRLAEAMRYSLEAGGKRIRPALVLECCATCGGEDAAALPAAAAIECVHTFSLIHDDLPAMDNDDLRRGRPTNHKVFGEAIAILAGDGLLVMAFELIAREVPDARVARGMMLELSRGSGREGMIGGQVLDLEGESQPAVAGRVRDIHALKTARLIETACRLGGLAARAPERDVDTLGEYGQRLGLAFQAVDDLLDVSGTSTDLGKTAGKDAAARKQSLPRAVGMEEGWRIAEELTTAAIERLSAFGGNAAHLVELARFVVGRKS